MSEEEIAAARLLRARQLARLRHGGYDVSIAEDADVEEVDDGFWVPARIYVTKGELDDCE